MYEAIITFSPYSNRKSHHHTSVYRIEFETEGAFKDLIAKLKWAASDRLEGTEPNQGIVHVSQWYD